MMAGNKPTIINTHTNPNTSIGCIECIRAGWVWCSAKWNYELPYAENSVYITDVESSDNVEKGNCCYSLVGKHIAMSDKETYNKKTCFAKVNNDGGVAAADSGTKNAIGTYWCSDFNLESPELAMVTCR